MASRTENVTSLAAASAAASACCTPIGSTAHLAHPQPQLKDSMPAPFSAYFKLRGGSSSPNSPDSSSREVIRAAGDKCNLNARQQRRKSCWDSLVMDMVGRNTSPVRLKSVVPSEAPSTAPTSAPSAAAEQVNPIDATAAATMVKVKDTTDTAVNSGERVQSRRRDAGQLNKHFASEVGGEVSYLCSLYHS